MGSQSTTNSTQSQNSTTNGSTSSAPSWAPQVAALTNAFNQADPALAHAQSYTATPGVNANLNGNGTLSNNGINLSNNGVNAAASGLGALSNFNAGATNNAPSVIDTAKQYVNGQDIQAQTNAAMQQAKELTRDVTLPGIDQNAALTGNSNSSRAGIAQGLVERGLAENSQNTYNNLYSQAFQNALNLAQGQANSNNTLNLQAANSAAGQGTNTANAGQNLFSGALNNVGTANNINQGNFDNNVNNSFAALQKYFQLIGNRSWGQTTNQNSQTQGYGTGTSTTQNDPGILSNISSGLGLLGSFL